METKVIKEQSYSFVDLLVIWRKKWLWILAAAIGGVSAAAVALALLPNRYEARMLLQVGKVGQVDQAGQLTSAPIETPIEAIERMHTASFEKEAAKLSGYGSWIDATQRGSTTGKAFFSTKLMAGTGLIEIKAMADSPDNAKKIAGALLEALALRESQLILPKIEHMQYELEQAVKGEAETEKEIKSLAPIPLARLRDDNFSQYVMLNSIKQQKDRDLHRYRQNIGAIKQALREPATQSAKPIENIDAQDTPVFPRKGMLLAIGLLGGLMLGMLLVLIKASSNR